MRKALILLLIVALTALPGAAVTGIVTTADAPAPMVSVWLTLPSTLPLRS